MQKTPPADTVVRAAQILLALNALVWLALGVATLLRQDTVTTGLILLAVLMAGNAGAMLLAAWLLAARRRIFYALTVGLLLANILLTFADQFGLLDLLTLLVDLFILGILLVRRSHFLPAPAANSRLS